MSEMAALYGWVKNIAFYMILMTLVLNIIPNNNYYKYIKLFSGMIMVVLVLSPIMEFLNLDSSMEHYFKTITFTEEVNQIKPLLEEADNERFSAVISEYRVGIEREMSRQAQVYGLKLQNADIDLCEDIEAEAFGTIVFASLVVSYEEEKSPIYIEPVKIMESSGSERESSASTAETVKLKEQLIKDYNLKEEQLQIYLKEEKNGGKGEQNEKN